MDSQLRLAEGVTWETGPLRGYAEDVQDPWSQIAFNCVKLLQDQERNDSLDAQYQPRYYTVAGTTAIEVRAACVLWSR
eukprot:COSAG01_NODE_2345_length_7860_cov_23.900528_5_plen_78_part_00